MQVSLVSLMVIRPIEEGLYWERLWAVFLIATLHLGTLGMTCVFFSAIFLSTKKTMVAAVIMMFLMFFIGGSYSFMRPGIGDPVQYASTWFYYNPAQFFGAGNFGNFLRHVLVLGGDQPRVGCCESLCLSKAGHSRLKCVLTLIYL